jgi:lipopolysaccharide export system protein LptA
LKTQPKIASNIFRGKSFRFNLLSLFLFAGFNVFPQEQIEVLNADLFEAMRGDVRRLVGNVVLKHGDATMYCDSAHWNTRLNSVVAFGNVIIQQGETFNLQGKRLNYNGNTKMVVITGDVVMTDVQMTLQTTAVNYNVGTRIGSYSDSAYIVSAENVLTSRRGYYYSATQDIYFHGDVILENPQYTMYSDTLQYNSASQVARFHGGTTIVSEENIIYCETGWYDTKTETANFGKNTHIQSGPQNLYADNLRYERNRGYGRATGNISVIDTVQNITIKGQFAEHFENQKRTYITRNVLLINPLENDTFYLSADTLRAEYDSSGYRIILAYFNAQTFSEGFQSISDSISYSLSDSMVQLFRNPVFWFDAYQGTADHVNIHTSNKQIREIEMQNNAFLASPEEGDTMFYNQIKGRNMRGFFAEGELVRLDVEGNGQSVYFARDEENRIIGVNRIESSDVSIYIENRKFSRITFKRNPSGTLYPPGEIPADQLILEGFSWHGEKRPENLESLNRQ